MKQIGIMAVLTILVLASVAQSHPLSSVAQMHVVRISTSLMALRESPSSHKANVAAGRAFELLLKDETPAGDEALAALAGHYLGESTEPECEILVRGKRMIPWLQRFNQNPPTIRLPASTAHSRSELIGQIEAGVRCE